MQTKNCLFLIVSKILKLIKSKTLFMTYLIWIHMNFPFGGSDYKAYQVLITF